MPIFVSDVQRAVGGGRCKRDGKRLVTLLDCEVGNHTGSFPITKTERGWACPEHGGRP